MAERKTNGTQAKRRVVIGGVAIQVQAYALEPDMDELRPIPVGSVVLSPEEFREFDLERAREEIATAYEASI